MPTIDARREPRKKPNEQAEVFVMEQMTGPIVMHHQPHSIPAGTERQSAVASGVYSCIKWEEK